MHRAGSIKRRLLLTLVGLISLTWLTLFFLVHRDATHELEEIYDASLAQNARILFGLLQREISEGEVELIRHIELDNRLQHPYELHIAFWAGIGKIVIKSKDAPEFLTELPEGLSTYTIDNSQWRVFTLRDRENELLIHTAQKLQAREELVSYLIRDTLSVMLLILPLLALLLWWGVKRSLGPLRRLMDEAGSMTARTLHPFDISDAPDEILPLVSALNQLLGRLDRAMENERRFTADAAHELRTPLAGLKVQLQVALRAEQPAQKQKAMTMALEGIDRITHLVNQLLTLARADRENAASLDFQRVDLVRIAGEVISALGRSAEKRGIRLDLTRSGDNCQIPGDATMLQIALRNLLENAIRYTRSPGQAVIEIRSQGERVSVWVRDSGEGIPAEAVERMFQRFRRGEHQASSGSGLGLSIVRRIAEIHQAEVLVDASDPEGFAIGLNLPRQAADQPLPAPPTTR
ncbi:MAG: ATP-binding protein [Sedimenticola sp.]|nr:ATP-binding protein [Sedimenticola sp.]